MAAQSFRSCTRAPSAPERPLVERFLAWAQAVKMRVKIEERYIWAVATFFAQRHCAEDYLDSGLCLRSAIGISHARDSHVDGLGLGGCGGSHLEYTSARSLDLKVTI